MPLETIVINLEGWKMIFFVGDLRMICARRFCTNFKQSREMFSSPLEEKLAQIGILCMEDAGRMLMHTKLKLCSRFCVVYGNKFLENLRPSSIVDTFVGANNENRDKNSGEGLSPSLNLGVVGLFH